MSPSPSLRDLSWLRLPILHPKGVATGEAGAPAELRNWGASPHPKVPDLWGHLGLVPGDISAPPPKASWETRGTSRTEEPSFCSCSISGGLGSHGGLPSPDRVSRWSCPRSWHCGEAESRPLMGTQRTRVQAQCREVEKDRAFWGPAHRPPPSPQSPRDPPPALPLEPQGLRAPPEHTSTWMDGSPATEQCPSSPWAHPALG